ncbi:MAG: hypothetical protein ICV60_24390, partial [Pyrinomonadaceae bacterium]|nr:hypothetical protein [Pyrinomonadaceae bacterium]
MVRFRFILTAVVIFCCSAVANAQSSFDSIEAFKKATLKGEDAVSAEAKGDLNGDGVEDWAGVVHRQKQDAIPTYQLYVLLGSGQGGYRVAETSKEAEIPGMGCCWVENLEIKRGSVYVQNNAKTASTMEAATHQFKLYNGQWRLVGLRIYYTDLGADTSTDTDMNLLTGAVIEKRQKGDNKPVSRNSRKKFATYLLKDFDFNNGFGTG